MLTAAEPTAEYRPDLDDPQRGGVCSPCPRRSAAEPSAWPRPGQSQRLSAGSALEPRLVETRLGGVFLLLRLLAESRPGNPAFGSGLVPSINDPARKRVLGALYCAKLIGKARKRHVMDCLAFDEGVALAVGLNVRPRRPAMAEMVRSDYEHADTRFKISPGRPRRCAGSRI